MGLPTSHGVSPRPGSLEARPREGDGILEGPAAAPVALRLLAVHHGRDAKPELQLEGYMVAPTANGDRPAARRVGTRSMLPSTWINRGLKIEYVTAGGKAATTEGVLRDWCPVGPILLIAGARTVLAWERLVL
jgi:hypothetical protein